MPPKLSARARVFSTGQGRKTDATDAHSVALVGTRMAGLRPLVNDEQLAVLRVLADRRRALGEDHTRMVAQLHHLLLELIPGGAKKDLSAAQAKALLAKVRPRDAAGKARRRVAAELVADLERIYARKKAANKELRELVEATGTSLLTLHGIGPSGAARLLIGVGDITRFPMRGHFASWNGTAPIDAPHLAIRSATGSPAPATDRSTAPCTSWPRSSCATRPKDAPTTTRKASGKTSMEAMRSEGTTVRHRLPAHGRRRRARDDEPGGHGGTSTKSSVTGSHPHTGSSDQSLPGPAAADTTTTLPAAS